MIGEGTGGRVAAKTALVLAMTIAGAAPLRAEPGGTDILSAETLTATADVRLVGVDGEQSWANGGFGKLRYGGDNPAKPSDFSLKPAFAEADIVWQPRFSWSLSGTVVGLVQGGDKVQAGLSEAFLSWKPLESGQVKLSARAGIMWPPVSLEHSGPEWAVTDSITPSAINSWIGEEVKILGAEATASTQFGGNKISLTGALFDMNDTAGALLTFRGWALHDRKILAFDEQPLPPLNAMMSMLQPRYTHPLNELDGGYMKRPGYYAKLTWQLPVPARIELFHYDNASNPESVNYELEWGWRTKFNDIGLVAEPSDKTLFRAQAMFGHSLMGYPMNGANWIDMRFRAGYAMLTRYIDKGSISARLDLFGTRNHGSAVTSQDDEDGWAAMLAGRRNLAKNLSVLAEIMHVESDRDARARAGLASEQPGNQVQLSLRARW